MSSVLVGRAGIQKRIFIIAHPPGAKRNAMGMPAAGLNMYSEEGSGSPIEKWKNKTMPTITNIVAETSDEKASQIDIPMATLRLSF